MAKATIDEIRRRQRIVKYPDPCCLVCDNWRITWAEPERSQGKGICLAQPDELRRGYKVTQDSAFCRKFTRTDELPNAHADLSAASADKVGRVVGSSGA